MEHSYLILFQLLLTEIWKEINEYKNIIRLKIKFPLYVNNETMHKIRHNFKAGEKAYATNKAQLWDAVQFIDRMQLSS